MTLETVITDGPESRRRDAARKDAKNRDDSALMVRQQLHELRTRFDIALRGSPVFLFLQDCNLEYVWLHNIPDGWSAEDLAGKNDSDVFDAPVAKLLTTAKQQVLRSLQETSFDVSVERSGSTRMFHLKLEPYFDLEGKLRGVLGVAIEETEQRAREEQLRQALREMSHRTRNQLATLLSVVRQTAARTTTIERFVDRLEARTFALAKVQEQLVESSWGGLDLQKLIRSQAESYCSDGQAIELTGPAVRLKPEPAQSVALAIHELALNAYEKGALSVPLGKVSVSWNSEEKGNDGDESDLILTWTESGGPPPLRPKKPGFGLSVVDRVLASALDGEVDVEFRKTGFYCRVRIPSSGLQ